MRGDPSHPANFGRLCTKGLSLHKADPSFRGLYPEIDGQRASWDGALDHVAAKFREVITQHGPDAVAFYISGQLLTEDYYVFNKLAKGLIGTNNVDTNSRLCMASAVAGYKQTLGADAPPACYEDLEAAECVFIAGSNTAWAHPILFQRIERPRAEAPHRGRPAPHRDRARRDAASADRAGHRRRAVQRHAARHEARRAGATSTTSSRTPRTSTRWRISRAKRRRSSAALPEQDIVEAAWLFAASRSTLSLYCQGLNQSSSGTAKNAALINLHLATGQIGKPGAGPFSLTGQPNAMGGREVGGMANLLSAHRDLSNRRAQRGDRRALGRAERPGTARQDRGGDVRGGPRGTIKAVWIACTNPAQSLPDQKLVHEALERAELVVVQDAYRNTETAAYADVFLPAAGGARRKAR